jgi:hypothetical protein
MTAKQMLRDLESHMLFMSQWEFDFVEKLLMKQTENVRISQKEFNKLEDIHARYCD